MNHKLRIISAAAVSWMPGYGIRRALMRIMLGYSIAPSARIGWRTLIAVSRFRADDDVQIGRFNVFKGPIDVRMERQSRVGAGNRFTCPWHIVQARFADRNYQPALRMCEGALFMDRHEVDLFGSVTLGPYSWFGGAGSQLWTHGLSVTDRNIQIGEGNYIGAATRFAPGTSLGDFNVVALGSVILSKTDVSECLIAGSPARPIRSIREERAAGRYQRSFADF